MKHALATGVTDPAAANREWAAIDKLVTDQAPAAVLFTPSTSTSCRSGCGNFVFNPQYYWLHTASWVQ